MRWGALSDRVQCQTCSFKAWGDPSLEYAGQHMEENPKHVLEWLDHAPEWRDTTVVTDPVTGGRKGAKLAQFSQIPADVLWELAEHYGVGMKKYPDSEDGEPNWQRGYSWRLSVDAMLRHVNQFLMGEDVDPDNGSSHLIAAAWHLFALRWFQIHGKGTDFREGK